MKRWITGAEAMSRAVLATVICFTAAGLADAQAPGRAGTAVGTRASLRPATTAGPRLGFVPQHTRTANARPVSSTRLVSETEVVDGGIYYEDPQTGRLMQGNASMLSGESPMLVEDDAKVAGGPSVMADPLIAEPLVAEMEPVCADASCGGCSQCAMVPCRISLPRGNLEGFVGVQGFTGPANRADGRGSFGFNQGLNWGMPVPGFGCLGAQAGFRATQSNLSGAIFTEDARHQGFVTMGLFRRVDHGLQGGAVIDYMTESWYHDVDLVNLRGEFSWVFNSTHDLGFWFSGGTSNTTVAAGIPNANPAEETWEGTDVYAFFYRRQFGPCSSGEARLLVGWSGNGDGLLGMDARVPLTQSWSLETVATYLIPKEGTGFGFSAGYTQEAWNVGINLVFQLDHLFGHGVDRYYQPLFHVADNGSFLFDRQ